MGGKTMKLTAEQIEALKKGELVRVSLPEIGGDVLVLRADRHEDIREVLEEERQRRAMSAVAIQNAIGRMNEDLP
jgi:hypothetical protein